MITTAPLTERVQSRPHPKRPTPVRHRAVLVVTCLALATVTAAMASLNVALPSIARDTHASQTSLSWVIDAYSLVFAALLLAGGAIGDRFGRRRALVIGLAVFGVGSALAPFTTSVHALIALRGVLGVGAALVMPATLSTITGTFPRERRAAAVSVWAAVAGASAVGGLLCSGLLLEQWSWRSIFVLNVVLAATAIVGTLAVVPSSADPDAPRIDVVGALGTVAAFGTLVYSIIEAPDHGWTAARTVGGLVAGLALLAAFVAWELRCDHPLIDPRLFARPAFSAGTLSIFLQFFAFFGFVFVAMQYLQLVRGDSALVAALSMLPMGLGMLSTSRAVPPLVARIGQRACCVGGLVLMGIGFAVLAQLDGSSSYWLVVTGLWPLGVGMGLAMTPATAAVTDSLPPALQGVGSAMNDLARELGGALGIAVLGSLLDSTYRGHLNLPGVPAPVEAQARSSLGVAAHLGNAVRPVAQHAFVDGMHVAVYAAAAVTCCAALAVAVLLRRPDISGASTDRAGSGQ
ncbi:MFS transporter [uncultured Jatrophihabitans sp.]|uniref:MFS transporter n=1 Tax=uncultured Jatrophihabitans sp. TaxID=1610747 RepID=UPI0035CAF2EE